MNWYSSIINKIAQYNKIQPNINGVQYINIGHNNENQDNWLWWSNNGSDVGVKQVTMGPYQDLTHDQVPEANNRGSWKGRFEGKRKILTVIPPYNLRSYDGIPNRLLHNLKQKFNYNDIKLYVMNPRTSILQDEFQEQMSR